MPNDIGYFRFYTQRVLPAVYGDELSYYEVLAKVRDKLNEIIEEMNSQGEGIVELQEMVTVIDKRVTELEQCCEDVKNGKYVELYLDSIINWIDAHLENLVARTVKFVCFGLSKDGYFQAYVPATWKFLKFDTGAVYGKPDYGCLILRW